MMGESFSPRMAEEQTGIRLAAGRERNEVGGSGRYKGKQVPHGSGELVARSGSQFLAAPDEEFFHAAGELVKARSGLGIDDFVLHVDVEHDGQCNVEFGQAFLSEVVRLGVPFTMSCFQADGR